jgi:hypothetical protein
MSSNYLISFVILWQANAAAAQATEELEEQRVVAEEARQRLADVEDALREAQDRIQSYK